MAIQLGTRQWKISAADVPTGIFWKSGIAINQIEFMNYNSSSDNVVILDQTGADVWRTRGNGDLSTERTGRVRWVNGMQITVLTAGEILVYLD